MEKAGAEGGLDRARPAEKVLLRGQEQIDGGITAQRLDTAKTKADVGKGRVSCESAEDQRPGEQAVVGLGVSRGGVDGVAGVVLRSEC